MGPEPFRRDEILDLTKCLQKLWYNSLHYFYTMLLQFPFMYVQTFEIIAGQQKYSTVMRLFLFIYCTVCCFIKKLKEYYKLVFSHYKKIL